MFSPSRVPSPINFASIYFSDNISFKALTGFEVLLVLVHREIVVSELLIGLIEGLVVQFSEEHSEEHAHIWVIVQGHDSVL